MRLYRKDNIYGEYRESQDTRAFRRSKKGQANSGEAEEKERQEEMGKNRTQLLIFCVTKRSYDFVQSQGAQQ